MTRSKTLCLSVVALFVGISIGISIERAPSGAGTMLPAAQAAGGVVTSPTAIAPDRYVYYPVTETLGEKGIRGALLICASISLVTTAGIVLVLATESPVHLPALGAEAPAEIVVVAARLPGASLMANVDPALPPYSWRQ